MKILKAFKFRAYPNIKQRAELARQFGHARFVYNHYRAAREGYYLDTGTGLNYVDCANDMSQMLKAEKAWLNEADSQALQNALKDLDRAYVNFFEGRAGYPNFKKKFGKQSIRYPQRFKVKDKRIYLPKVGWVRTVFHREIEGVMKNCTISKTKSGRYFVSIQVEMEIEDPTPQVEAVGIDLGLTTFATLSTGEKINKSKHLYRCQRRLKIRQRRLSRKVKGSNSRNAARVVLATLHEKVANQRRDFQHKLSRYLADNYGVISFESLNISGMLKNHNLAKAISDAGWNQFVTFCEYKAGWNNGQVLRVDRFFPSSKLCNDCGGKHKSLTLNIRQWVCVNCDVIHDRDINAAINILNHASTEATTTVGITESYAVGYMTGEVDWSAPEAQPL